MQIEITNNIGNIYFITQKIFTQLNLLFQICLMQEKMEIGKGMEEAEQDRIGVDIIEEAEVSIGEEFNEEEEDLIGEDRTKEEEDLIGEDKTEEEEIMSEEITTGEMAEEQQTKTLTTLITTRQNQSGKRDLREMN